MFYQMVPQRTFKWLSFLHFLEEHMVSVIKNNNEKWQNLPNFIYDYMFVLS